MQYDFPSHAAGSGLPDWPRGIGGIPVQLSGGVVTELPVLPGTNVLTFGVVGTGKTRSYTMPAAEVLLSHVPGMRGVFFEIKRSFLQRFLQPDDKIITYDPASVPADNLFRPCLIREIRQANNRESEMRQIAEFLFADLLEGANQNRSWIEAARNTWIAVLRTIVDCYPNEDTSNWQLVNALRRMPLKDLLAYLAKHPRNESLLRKDFGYDPRNGEDYCPTRRAEDILFFFNQVLELFSGAFESKGTDTICNYLSGRYGRNLFFLYDLASAESSRPFFRYYLKKLKDFQMSNRKESTAPMLWVLDEVDKMADSGKAADFGLYQAANLGREYGLQILLTTQSMENLFGLSPEFNPHITTGGLAGFPMVLSFRPGDPTTVQTLQTLFGSRYREHLVLPVSRYRTPEIRFEREPVVTDEEFSLLRTGECYAKLGACSPQKVTFLNPL